MNIKLIQKIFMWLSGIWMLLTLIYYGSDTNFSSFLTLIVLPICCAWSVYLILTRLMVLARNDDIHGPAKSYKLTPAEIYEQEQLRAKKDVPYEIQQRIKSDEKIMDPQLAALKAKKKE